MDGNIPSEKKECNICPLKDQADYALSKIQETLFTLSYVHRKKFS
jgi:hypothetical protein